MACNARGVIYANAAKGNGNESGGEWDTVAGPQSAVHQGGLESGVSQEEQAHCNSFSFHT